MNWKSTAAFFSIALFSLVRTTARAQQEPDYLWVRGGPGRSIRAAVRPLDGAFTVTLNQSNDIQFWRSSDGALTGSYRLRYSASELAMSQDGERFAVCSNGRGQPINIVRVADGVLEAQIPIDPGFRAWRPAISGDGSLVAAIVSRPDPYSYALLVMVWRVEDGELLQRWSWDQRYPEAIAFSPNGLSLVVGVATPENEYPFSVRLLNTRTGRQAWSRTLLITGGSFEKVVFSPSGSMIAVGLSGTGVIPILSPTNGAIRRLLAGGPGSTTSIAFSADSRLLAASDFTTTNVWKVSTGQRVQTMPTPAELAYFNHSGDTLLTIGRAEASSAWRIADGSRLFSFGESLSTLSLAVDAAGEFFAIRAGEPVPYVQLRRVADAGVEWRYTQQYQVGPLDYSRDGRWLAVVDNEYWQLSLINAQNASQRWRVSAYRDASAVAFSPDGSQIAVSHTIGDQDAVMIFERGRGERVRSFGDSASAIAWSPDGELLAVDPESGPVQIWRPEARMMLFEVGDNDERGPLAFSPDGALLCTHGGASGRVSVWSASNGSLVRRFDSPATLARFLTDEILMTCDETPSYSYWNTHSGALLRLEDRNVLSRPRTMSASADARTIMVGRTNGQICAIRNPCLPAHGDLEGDCQTGLGDLRILLASFGTCDGDAEYNPIADVVESGCVDTADLIYLLSHIGR